MHPAGNNSCMQPTPLWSVAEVNTEPECRSGLRKESAIFAEVGAGLGVGFLNEIRSRSWNRRENFSFHRSRMFNFIKS